MKRYLSIVLMLFFVFMHSGSSQAMNVLVKGDPLEEAGLKALNWFKSLMSSLDDIVDTEKKTQLENNLRNLGKSLYSIESDKRVLLQRLERGSLSPDDKELLNLIESITEARSDLKLIGFSMKEKHRQGGLQVENLLSQAIDGKSWVEELRKKQLSKEKTKEVLEQGQKALQSLSEANAELAKLIGKL